MTYTQAAVERAVKAHEVLMQALSGRQPWIHVAEVLGVSARTVRRRRWRYEQYGFTGLYDHRQRTPSPRAVPLAGSNFHRPSGLKSGRSAGEPFPCSLSRRDSLRRHVTPCSHFHTGSTPAACGTRSSRVRWS